MYVGDQAVPLTTQALQFRARHGCYHIDSDLGGRDAALELDEQGYADAIAMCAAEGVTLEMTHISIPESITLALPERDADIERCADHCVQTHHAVHPLHPAPRWLTPTPDSQNPCLVRTG